MKRGETLEIDGRRIQFSVERRPNRRRTMALKVTRTGEVLVLAPPQTPLSSIRTFVTEKAAWVEKHLSATTRLAEKRIFGPGATVPFLGRELPLVLEKADIKRARPPIFASGALSLMVPAQFAGEERTEFILRSLRLWYRPRADKRLLKTTSKLARATGFTPGAVRAKNLSSSWGICRGQDISLNWRLIMAPENLIEYVVYHELCHLKHRGHSAEFWAAVARCVPDHKKHRQALRDLDLGWI